MKNSIEKLKNELLNHPKVVNSILNNSNNWKRNHYIFLSNLIEEELKKSEFMTQSRIYELGNSISDSTIKRFFSSEDTYYSNDLRFIKTLDKFCIFLGYYDLNDFLQKNSNHIDENNNKKTEKNTTLNLDFFQNLIQEYCLYEFECLKKIPNVDFEDINKYVFENSPFQKRVKRNILGLCELEYTYDYENNHSNFEIFNFKILTMEKNLVVISTKEFWNLSFKNKNGNPTPICNFSNKQEYYIKKINSSWKIWDNFNSNSNNFIENAKKFSDI